MKTKEQVRALNALVFRHYIDLRDREELRYQSFMKYAYFLIIWFLSGLLLMKGIYGVPDSLPGAYFPTIGFVVWAGVMGSTCSILVRFINLDVSNRPLVAHVESALKTGFGAIVVGSILSLLAYAALAGGAVKSDLLPEFISSRSAVVMVETVPTNIPQSTNESTNEPQDIAMPRDRVEEGRIKNYRNRTELDAKYLDKTKGAEEGLLLRLMRDMMPVSSKSLALLLVWCFFAGYSQTWILDRIKKSLG